MNTIRNDQNRGMPDVLYSNLSYLISVIHPKYFNEEIIALDFLNNFKYTSAIKLLVNGVRV